MDKGTLKKIITTNTPHRIPKIATLAVTTCMLVAMVAIDASASPNSTVSSITRIAKNTSVVPAEASLSLFFRIEHHRHRIAVKSTSPDATRGGSTTPTSVGVGSTAPTSAGAGGATAGAAPTNAPTPTAAVVPTTQQPVVPTTQQPVAPTTTTTVAPTPTTTVAPSTPQPVGAAAGPWNLVFDSEFSGSSLDASQWSTGWFGSGVTKGANSAEVECMDPAQVNVANGELDLSVIAQSETCSGVTQQKASGMVTTDGKFSFTYGYMEARIWLPSTGSITDWPAFWADGQVWPTNGEIDVMEGLDGLAQAHFHYSGGADGPLTGRGTFTGGWHTFAANWEPGSVTYYYDGDNIGSFTTGITSAPMYLILDLATSAGNATPGTMRIDDVRVWQH